MYIKTDILMKYYTFLFIFVTMNTKMERHVNHPYAKSPTAQPELYIVSTFTESKHNVIFVRVGARDYGERSQVIKF